MERYSNKFKCITTRFSKKQRNYYEKLGCKFSFGLKKREQAEFTLNTNLPVP